MSCFYFLKYQWLNLRNFRYLFLYQKGSKMSKEKENMSCFQCGKEISKENSAYIDGKPYCKQCYLQIYFEEKKKRLLEHLVKMKYLNDKRLLKAFMEVPLEEFIPSEFRDPLKIYEDIPNLFYYEKPENYRTISAPHMISIMLQGLALKDDDDLLILGAKSGYIAALAHKLAPNGEIIILEANSEIAKITDENLKRLNLHENITVNIRNPLEGMPELGPWQKILVTGAIKQERIHTLLKQLDINEGVLYAPIGEEIIQIYTQILRINEDFFGKKQLQVRFTPLMTQVELDELELVTDFDEFEDIEIKDDPHKVEETLGSFENKIRIKYTPSIFDEFEIEKMPIKIEKNIDIKEKDKVISYLQEIEEIIKKLKKEDNIAACFDLVEDIEVQIDFLNKLKKTFNIKMKKIQHYLNEIRACNIIRKGLRNKDLPESDKIEEQMKIINKQMEDIHNLHDLLVNQIERIKNLK